MKSLLPLSLAALLLGSGTLALTVQDGNEAEAAQRELAAKAFAIADYDHNGWISFQEARASLEIDRPRYLVYDKDRDGSVTLEEYIAICLQSWRRYGVFKIPLPNPRDPSSSEQLRSLGLGGEGGEELEPEYMPAEAGSIIELFGQRYPRVVHPGSSPEPEQIIGPVHSFRRLDYDDDGNISVDDLAVLLLGSGLQDRPQALIAILDKDGDGQLSEVEFLKVMGTKP